METQATVKNIDVSHKNVHNNLSISGLGWTNEHTGCFMKHTICTFDFHIQWHNILKISLLCFILMRPLEIIMTKFWIDKTKDISIIICVSKLVYKYMSHHAVILTAGFCNNKQNKNMFSSYFLLKKKIIATFSTLVNNT